MGLGGGGGQVEIQEFRKWKMWQSAIDLAYRPSPILPEEVYDPLPL